MELWQEQAFSQQIPTLESVEKKLYSNSRLLFLIVLQKMIELKTYRDKNMARANKLAWSAKKV